MKTQWKDFDSPMNVSNSEKTKISNYSDKNKVAKALNGLKNKKKCWSWRIKQWNARTMFSSNWKTLERSFQKQHHGKKLDLMNLFRFWRKAIEDLQDATSQKVWYVRSMKSPISFCILAWFTFSWKWIVCTGAIWIAEKTTAFMQFVVFDYMRQR